MKDGDEIIARHLSSFIEILAVIVIPIALLQLMVGAPIQTYGSINSGNCIIF